jgi:hypothetical protein
MEPPPPTRPHLLGNSPELQGGPHQQMPLRDLLQGSRAEQFHVEQHANQLLAD